METFLIVAIKSVLLVVILLTVFAHFMLIERKFLGYFQLRLGPNRVGPWGLAQPIADAVKVIIKEDIIPHDADRITYKLAPVVSLFVALAAYASIPVAPPVEIFGRTIELSIVNPNAGSSCCWRRRRWASTASPWVGGRRRASIPSWACCVRRRR